MTGKKLVLIVPPSPWLISDLEKPFYGVLYLSSYLKRCGHEVVVCDLAGLPEEMWKIPVGDVYGLTGTTPHCGLMKKIAAYLRRREPNALVVAGGPHATALPEKMIEDGVADICVLGEGEVAMSGLLRDPHSLHEIPGIVFRNPSGSGPPEIVRTPRVLAHSDGAHDLDHLPPPDREAIDIYRYLPSRTYHYLLGDCMEVDVLTSRGCPYRCSFCASALMHPGRPRYHSVSRVIEEVEYVRNRYGVDLICFMDDTFIVDSQRVERLAERLRTLNLHWYCLSRSDCCHTDTLRAMASAGCIGMIFGFESGSDAVLAKANKGFTVADSYSAIRRAKQFGIKIRAQLVVGLPGETDHTVSETGDFIRRAAELGVDKFGIHVFQPFPGCPVWKRPEDYGFILDKAALDFDSMHTIGRPGEDGSASEVVRSWAEYLRSVAGEHNIEVGYAGGRQETYRDES